MKGKSLGSYESGDCGDAAPSPEQSGVNGADASSRVMTIVPPNGQFKFAVFLVIVAGIVSLLNGLVAVYANSSFEVGPSLGINRYSFCGVLVIVLGVGAILGGTASFKLRRLTPGFAGAAMGMVAGGLFGFWCGLAALVLFFLSDEDL